MNKIQSILTIIFIFLSGIFFGMDLRDLFPFQNEVFISARWDMLIWIVLGLIIPITETLTHKPKTQVHHGT